MEVSALLDISNFPWAECAITDNAPMYAADSLSLSRQSLSTGNHRYEFELVTYDMDHNQGRSVMAQLAQARGSVLSYVHPKLSYSMGVVPDSGIDLSAGASRGDKSVTMISAEEWELMAGDYICFSSHSKVYQVAKNTGLSTGLKVVELANPLIASVASGTSVTCNDVPWQLTTTGTIEAGMEALENQDIQITLVAVEKI